MNETYHKQAQVKARDHSKSEGFKKRLNRKVSGLGSLARTWKSASDSQTPQR